MSKKDNAINEKNRELQRARSSSLRLDWEATKEYFRRLRGRAW